MTPSEKEKIIKESFDAIRKVYNLRDDLLSDADKLEAARESNRKLSDRVANLEVTIKALNSAIDKKDVEIKRLNNRLKSRDDAMLTTIEALEENRDAIFDNYLELCHTHDADEEIKKRMIADNRKKKEEIKSLREELEAEKKSHCCDGCGSIRKIKALEKGFEENRKVAEKYKTELDLLRKAHTKLCGDYNKLHEALTAEVMGYATHYMTDEELDAEKCKSEIAKLEDNFHELREKFNELYLMYTRGMLEPYHIIAFSDWFKDTFGDFGIYDGEEK